MASRVSLGGHSVPAETIRRRYYGDDFFYTGLDDPLDRRVVEAYWVGSPRLDQVGTRAVGDSMEDRFRFMTGARFASLTESVLAGGVPHHSFAVFCIYP